MKGGTHAYDEIFLTLIKMAWEKKVKKPQLSCNLWVYLNKKLSENVPHFSPQKLFNEW